MSKNKHLSIFDRNKIVGGLLTRKSLRYIALDMGKDVSTVSREIKSHMVIERKGAAYQRGFNDCIYRNECNETYVCNDINCTKDTCRNCGKCINYCSKYKREEFEKKVNNLPSLPKAISSGRDPKDFIIQSFVMGK